MLAARTHAGGWREWFAVAEVEIDVLGPLCLRVDGEQVPVPGVRRRGLLALLALEGGRSLSVDGILDALWRDSEPASGRATVQTQISRLRSHLGPRTALLRREGPGYALKLDADAVDAVRASALAARGRNLLTDDPEAALELFTDALALWRGPALAEFPDVQPLAAESRRLAELRAVLVDASLQARLALQPPGDVARDTARAAADDPWRESTHRLLMTALALDGRTAEAMDVARGFRRRLAEETGLEPSPSFVALERSVAAGTVRPTARRAHRRLTVPHAPTPLLGRDAELAALATALAGERCVTVVGPGGVGKTRLALEWAHHAEADGAILVELAPVREAGTIPYVLAHALGIRGTGDLMASVLEHLAARDVVLIVDNCEHVLDASRRVCDELLRWCPTVRVLATSRQPLGAVGEWVFRLQPLALPPEHAAAADTAAVRLFVDRARRARPDFDLRGDVLTDVLAICRQVDGLPLAIELAAGRIAGVSIAELRRRLPAVLDLGGPGRRSDDDRHRTLRATVAWSYKLLGPGAQSLFRHLAVFPDRFELAAAEHLAQGCDIAGDPLLTVMELVDASMMTAEVHGDIATYRMLDTMRTFGAEQLAVHQELAAANRLMAGWALGFAERASAGVQSPDEPVWDARILAALPTLRAARRYLLDAGDVVGAARISVALEDFALWRQHAEPWAWALELAELPQLRGTPVETLALATACRAAMRLGKLRLAGRLATRAEQSARDDEGRGEALGVAGLIDSFTGDNRAAVRRFTDAAVLLPELARNYLANAALSAAYSGDIAEALGYLDEADRLTGPSQGLTVRAWVAYARGEVLSRIGDPQAATHLQRARALAHTSRASLVEGMSGISLAVFAARTGDVAAALTHFLETVQGWQRSGSWALQWITLRAAAVLLAGLGQDSDALTVLIAADSDADAPMVREADAARFAQVQAEVERRLGATQARQVSDAARRTPRTEIVDRALAALTAAAAAGRSAGVRSGQPGIT